VHSKKFTTYASSVLALTKEDAVFFEEKGKGDTVINGYETSWAQITVLHQKAADDEKKEQKIYFVKGEAGNIYMIICTAHKDGISSIQNSIDKVLQSFKVINEGRKPNK
jgi:phosphoenolpyruvate synthase/pyruvate phosphate dikinase